MAYKLTAENITPKTGELKLYHPIGGETDAVIYLKGTTSTEYLSAEFEVQKKATKIENRENLTLDQTIELMYPAFAACVIGWNDELAEAIGPFSTDTVQKFWSKESGLNWIGLQIAGFIQNSSNFFSDAPSSVGEVGSAQEQ